MPSVRQLATAASGLVVLVWVYGTTIVPTKNSHVIEEYAHDSIGLNINSSRLDPKPAHAMQCAKSDDFGKRVGSGEEKVALLQKLVSRVKVPSAGSEQKNVDMLKNTRLPPKQKDTTRSSPAIEWSVVSISIVIAAVIGFVCFACQCGCLAWLCCLSPFSVLQDLKQLDFDETDFQRLLLLLAPTSALLADDDNVERSTKVMVIVRQEMKLMMLYPLIPWIAFSQSTCLDGPPTWVYFLYIPLLMRSKVIEFKLLQHLGQTSHVYSIAFLIGFLEHLDYYTDGIFPLQALKCEPGVTQDFASSFLHSMFPFMAPLVGKLHFYGIAIVLLCSTIFAQQALGVAGRNSQGKVHRIVSADVACFGGLSNYYDSICKDDISRHGRDAYLDGMALFETSIVRTLLGNCCQLWLQSSYFALVFAKVSRSAKVKSLLSLILGLASATNRAYIISMWSWRHWISQSQGTAPSAHSQVRMGVIGMVQRTLDRVIGGTIGMVQRTLLAGIGLAILAISPALIFAMVAWTAAKVYFAFVCPHHIWNLTSGCVSK